MARIDNLTNFLTDVATAIKEKKGSQTAIPAANFDTEIATIEGGGTTINNQDKTVTRNGVYTADTGYTGLGTVTVDVDPSQANYEIYTGAYIGGNNVVVRDNTTYTTYKQIEIDLSQYLNHPITITNTGDRNVYGFTATKPENNTPLNAERQSTSGSLVYTYTGGNDRYLVYDFTTSNQSDTVITITVNLDPEYNTNLNLSDDILDLPYTKLEYIESNDGNQYINTNMTYSNTMEVKTKFRWKSLTNNTYVFGSDYYNLGYYSNSLSVSYPDNYLGGVSVNTDYEIDFNNASHKLLVNDVQKSFTYQYNSTGASLKVLVLSRGSIYGSAVNMATNARLYYFKIINNSTEEVLMDLIPVKRNSDNVVCMYDLVSDTFFTNQGTGSFIAGPEKYK